MLVLHQNNFQFVKTMPSFNSHYQFSHTQSSADEGIVYSQQQWKNIIRPLKSHTGKLDQFNINYQLL